MLRSDESDVLAPGDLGVTPETEGRLRGVDAGGGIEETESLDLSVATRCAVEDGNADINIGGNATCFGAFGSAADKVYS